ncbi:hypothetical protein BIU88_02315 [Chlorobaculum limnaeum]|jgi:hypothetical protein|uniref:Uncharacterized protein n=1 Tax=Chlorobaculum limnaeum TaxID=274537 RepID=A0A1D8CY63_CHLLM|nr:hypothetical protein BIU88_02315 [Chlorobaculum limnaeum]
MQWVKGVSGNGGEVFGADFFIVFVIVDALYNAVSRLRPAGCNLTIHADKPQGDLRPSLYTQI